MFDVSCPSARYSLNTVAIWFVAAFRPGDTEKHFPLSRRERRAYVAQPFAETGNEFARSDQVGKRQRQSGCAEDGVLDGAHEQRGRRASRHHDHPIASINRGARRRETDHGLTKRLKVGNADETSAARSWGSIHSLQATSYMRRLGTGD